MSRSQDTVIDDDEETCPLCIEEFDLSDKNFRPCPCGYQICQFCFNSLKTTYEKSTCPNCRRQYDEKTIQYKIPTAEEFKLDQLNKNKKQAAAKRKETEKREVETSSRRNLAGVRVKQQNLVYVIGLSPTKADESTLLETLRGRQYFGQYGEIEKIVVSKAKAGAVNQGVGVYVTYARKEDAACCISSVDGSTNGEHILRAQYGTTKYCSAFLRGETCNNKSCSFLHETGEDGQNTTLQNEPIPPKALPRQPPPSQIMSMGPPPRTQSTPQPSTFSQPMARQSSKDDAVSRIGNVDPSALPSTAGWANTNPLVARTGHSSQAESLATPSPQSAHAALALPQSQEDTPNETASPVPSSEVPQTTATSQPSTKPKVSNEPAGSSKQSPYASDPFKMMLDTLVKNITSAQFRFNYDDSWMTPEERARIDEMPPMIDPYGGAKRRVMEDKEVAERERIEAEAKAKLESQAKSAAEDALDEEALASGSLALGGEPEDNHRSTSARGAIGRPPQSASNSNFVADQFPNVSVNGRSSTPQQRQQLSASNPRNVQQAPGLSQPPASNTAFEMSDFDRRGPQYSQAQYDQISNHQRHGSRYFNNEAKAGGTPRFQGQQSFYSSGVQGPPPGLPTAGTPPVSGGGMFSHGQNFTNPGFGTVKENNAEMHMRGRSGTNTAHEMTKRELLLSLQNNPLTSPPPPASALGLVNPLYGQYPGAYQDSGLVKQRKKGKKQRHANTPSSGGGGEHLADPSILQARVHQAGGAGQGLPGGTQVDEENFPPLPPRPEVSTPAFHSRVSSFQSLHSGLVRTSTPKIPPGFDFGHAHPPPSIAEQPTGMSQDRPNHGAAATILPAVPLMPIGPRLSAAKEKAPAEGSITSGEGQNLHASDKNRPAMTEKGKAAEVSFGSPKVRGTRLKAERAVTLESGAELGGIVGTAKSQQSTTANGSTSKPAGGSATTTDDVSEDKSQTWKSGAIDIPRPNLATILTDTATIDGNATTTVLDAAVVSTPTQINSKPASPDTTISEVSRTSLPHPRVIRVTTSMSASKVDAMSATSTTERSTTLPTVAQLKQEQQRSRQASISSVSRSRPSTPALSDKLSQNVSRASSPPPSVVGSAAERVKSKNQQKKERREKAKKVPDTSDVANATPATPPATESVAPVIARQKKQKKQRGASGVGGETLKNSHAKSVADDGKLLDSIDSSRQVEEAPAGDEERAQSASPARSSPAVSKDSTPIAKARDEKPRMEDLPKQPYFLRDLYNDAAKFPTDGPDPLPRLLDTHISSMPKILSSFVASGDLTRDHPWLHPPSFNSAAYKLQADARKGQDYLDGNGYTSSNAFGYVYLPQKEKRALYAGHAVSVADGGERKNDLLRRCLITPNGWVMRHLSAEECEKVLELEERRSLYAEEFGEIGLMSGLGMLEQDDYTNLGGGIEQLGRWGERHGVCWVAGDDAGNGDDADDFEDGDDEGLLADLEAEEGLLSDETDDDLGLGLDEQSARDPLSGGAAWDAARTYGAAPAAAAPLQHPRSNTLAPIADQNGSRHVNLRALDADSLHKRMQEKSKEAEAARKEVERLEKAIGRKSKEIGRWRESILKG